MQDFKALELLIDENKVGDSPQPHQAYSLDDENVEELFVEQTKAESNAESDSGQNNNFFAIPAEFLKHLEELYYVPETITEQSQCFIKPNSKWKMVWDFYIVFLLLIVSILVPYRLAFFATEDSTWRYIYLIIDACFLVDMILTFFTALLDPKT